MAPDSCWFLFSCSWHLPPQRQTSLHWCSCNGWLFHTLLLFLGNPCYRTYLWDEPASKSTGRWKEILSTLQWVRSRARGTEEGPIPGKCSLDITTVVWRSFGSRICASSQLYYQWTKYIFVYLGACQSCCAFDIHRLCRHMVEIFQVKNFHHHLNYSFSCSRPRLIPISFQWLTEMFRLGEQSPRPPPTSMGTPQHLQRVVQVQGEMIKPFLHLVQRVFSVISCLVLACVLMAWSQVHESNLTFPQSLLRAMLKCPRSPGMRRTLHTHHFHDMGTPLGQQLQSP